MKKMNFKPFDFVGFFQRLFAGFLAKKVVDPSEEFRKIVASGSRITMVKMVVNSEIIAFVAADMREVMVKPDPKKTAFEINLDDNGKWLVYRGAEIGSAKVDLRFAVSSLIDNSQNGSITVVDFK